ncbi:MAG: metallophosphoesterase, partial [Maritimibacter sp.]
MSWFVPKTRESPQGGNAAPQETAPRAHIRTLAEMPAAIYAVGDVHGMRALYQELEARIVEDAATAGINGPKLIVLLGDLIDRGPDSAGLIDDLIAPAPTGFQCLVLRGNHDDKMRDFIANPGQHREWLGYGGDATLASYGLKPDPIHGFNLSPRKLENMVRSAIPETHARFLENLPYGLRVGDYFFCHAGINPETPITAQNPDALLWGDPERIDKAAGSLPVIVHGHIAIDDILITSRRINVDTGAYASGKLSAVRLQANATPFGLSAGESTRRQAEV